MLKRTQSPDSKVKLVLFFGLFAVVVLIGLLFVGECSIPEQQRQAGSSVQNGAHEEDHSAVWRSVMQRLVSSEDTLAQWLMAVFSILAVLVSGLAVYWVKKTYDATVEMAADNRAIGQAQSRAYLTVEGVVVMLAPGDQFPFIKVVIRNSGQSPARRVRVVIKFDMTMNAEGVSVRTVAAPPVVLPKIDVQAGSLIDGHYAYVQSLRLEAKDFGETFERLISLKVKVAVLAKDVFNADVFDLGYFVAGWSINEDRSTPKDMHRFDAFTFSDEDIKEMRDAVKF